MDDPDGDAEVLVLGWGSTFGPIAAACRAVRAAGHPVAQVHLRHLNLPPANTGAVVRRYRRVIIPEMNLGQLALLIRGRYLVDARLHNQVRGLPFQSSELADVILTEIGDQDLGCRVHPPREPDVTTTDLPALDLVPVRDGLDGPPIGQGVQERPRSSVVPGLRRLRDPGPRCRIHAEPGPGPTRTSCSSRGSAVEPVPRTT